MQTTKKNTKIIQVHKRESYKLSQNTQKTIQVHKIES